MTRFVHVISNSIRGPVFTIHSAGVKQINIMLQRYQQRSCESMQSQNNTFSGLSPDELESLHEKIHLNQLCPTVPQWIRTMRKTQAGEYTNTQCTSPISWSLSAVKQPMKGFTLLYVHLSTYGHCTTQRNVAISS